MERLNHDKKNILLLSSDLSVAGGLERMVVSLANKLSENNYTVSLLMISPSDQSFYFVNKEIYSNNLDLDFGMYAQHNYLTRKFDFFSDIKKLKKKIKELSPDIIISSDYVQTSSLVWGGLNKKFPVISWQHTYYGQPKSTVWKTLSNLSYKKVQAIVCLNIEEAEIYKRFNKNTLVIPNFIESSVERSDLNSKKILTISRLTKEKGIDLLEKTALTILKKYPDWQWDIVGEGNLKSGILKAAKENDLLNRLNITQPNSSIEIAYLSASLYVMPSRLESFSMVIIEAMNYGLPVISFDCDNGPRHIIQDKIDGILVEKEDTQKLAEAIELLIENEPMRKKMGDLAKKNVQRFYSEKVIEQWKHLFNQVLS